MAIELRDEMFAEYYTRGYLIFRNVIPPALLKDLRREAAKARELAYQVNGPQTQRIQPIAKYADKIDQRPFQDYCELPNLHDLVRRLLGLGYTHGHRDIMGLLLEPRDKSWNQGWHRDGIVEVPVDAQDAQLHKNLEQAVLDIRVWNQVNCALYNDCCTWYVPGSHLRLHDLPGERQTIGDKEITTDLDNASDEEREIRNIQHARGFPGAVQTQLGPGDYMVYRNFAWHCGNYVKYQPRATIHDVVQYHPQPGETYGHNWWDAKRAAIARMEDRKKAAAPGTAPVTGATNQPVALK